MNRGDQRELLGDGDIFDFVKAELTSHPNENVSIFVEIWKSDMRSSVHISFSIKGLVRSANGRVLPGRASAAVLACAQECGRKAAVQVSDGLILITLTPADGGPDILPETPLPPFQVVEDR